MKRTFTFLVSLFLMVGTMWADVTDLPQISTVEKPIYYTIMNTRSSQPGGLMYFAGDAVGLKDEQTVVLEAKHKFFFTGSHDAMYIHNAATGKKLASVGSWTEDGAVWAVGVSPMGGGLAFGPKGGLNGNSCWNEKNFATDEKTSDFTTWSANDAGSIFIVDLAENYVFPKTDLFYVIEAPLFEKTQGVKKAIYVNNEGKAVWGTEDLTNHNFYWIPTVNAETGKVVLKNFGTQTYLSSADGTMAAESKEATLKILGDCSFNININGTIHANNHDGGKGSGSNFVSWGGNAGSASAWRFVQKNDPTKLQEAVVTYNLTYGDEVKYTQTVTTLVGEEWPAITVALPYTVSATKPEGVIAAEDLTDGAVTKEIALTIGELPFVAAADVKSIDTWYYVKMHSNTPKYIQYLTDQTYLEWVDAEKDETAKDTYAWAFVGNIFDGFKVVNKAAAKAMQSTADGAVVLVDYADASQYVLAATRETSEAAKSGFCLRRPDANKECLNASAGKVAHWWDNDAGSTFMLEVVENEPEVEYADETLINAFIAEVVALGELSYDLDATWAALPAVSAELDAVTPLIEQLGDGNPVAKADVEAATATVANAKAVATYYNETYLPTAKAATELLAALENGSAEHTALSAAIAACDLSAVTTVAELETMEAALAEAVEANTPEGGLVKTDYTDAIKNAAVTSKDEWNAEGASFGTPEKKDELVKYGSGKLVDFNQTITIPAGKYKMTAKAVYRYTGSEQSEYEAIQAGTNTHLAKLYAETSSCKYETNVMNRWEGASDTDYAAGNGSVTVNGKFVPNSSAAVKAWFDNGMYVNELVFNVQADGEVKIGIETKETVPGGEYTNISAWTLTRLGDAEADPNDYTDAIKNAAVTSKDEWNAEGASFGTPEKKDELVKYGSGKLVDFNQTITIPAGKYKMTAKAVYRYTGSEQSEYEAIQAGTNTHLAKLYAETSSYKYETNVMNRWEGASDTDYAAGNGSVTVNGKFVPNSSAAVKAWFDNGMYVNELVFNVQADGEVKIGIETKETVPGGEYTNISSWTLRRIGDAEADPKPVEVVFKPGQDATFMIENAQVTSASGWVNGSANKDQQYTGAPDNTYLDWCNWSGKVETMDMHQVVPNMPAGYYTLKVATRAHNKMNGVVYAITDVDTYSTEIHHVDNVGNELGGGWGWTVVEGFAMAARGNMTIGFKVTAPEDGVWAGADNFMLTYLGATELEVAQYEFLTVKDQFDLMSTGIYQVMYVGRMGVAYEALSEKVWALASKEDATAEEYKACVAEMKAVMADIETAEDYYVNVFSPLANECFEVQDNSVAKSEEAAEAFAEACDKMGWSGTMGVATVADLEAIVAEVQPALNAYVLNAIPINGVAFNYSFFLTNPSFETGNIDGWTVGSSADTGVRENAGGYATANGDGDYLFNTWWQGVMLSQEAEGLPNGNYRLTASLASGDGGKAATIFLVANGEKKGFTMDHKGEFEDCSIEFKVTDGKVSIATIGGNDDASYNENGHWWYKSDNYRIHYLGDGGVTGVSLWTKETYYDEWAKEDVQYDLEWDMPELTEIGATFKFEVSVEAPEDADTTIVWSVSNDKVLSIDQTGLLTVIGSGSGFYEVMATAPNGISATCKVKVEAFQEGDITEMEIVYEGGWWIESTMAGETFQLGVEYNEDAANVDLVWSSTNEKVATVDQNGLVTIVGSGEADIVVTASSGVQASISVVAEISEEDGIDNKSVEADAVIYDLSGRRVEKMTKGLYIVNGRKVMVK